MRAHDPTALRAMLAALAPNRERLCFNVAWPVAKVGFEWGRFPCRIEVAYEVSHFLPKFDESCVALAGARFALKVQVLVQAVRRNQRKVRLRVGKGEIELKHAADGAGVRQVF